MRKYALLYIIVIAIASTAFAQDDFTIGHFQNLRDNEIYFKGINTAIRPATGIENKVYDSIIFPQNDKVDKNWFVRKLFHEHLFIISDDKYKVYFDPIFDFRYNRLNNLSDPSNPTAVNGYTNTRGAIVHAKLGKKVYFNTSIYENQAVLPAYMEEVYRIKGNIPGYARVKKLNGYSEFDYANAYGNISFSPIRHTYFTLGYDRLFIGDGIYSMILSDYGAPTPYFKAYINFGKTFEYTVLVSRLMQYNMMKNVENVQKTSRVSSMLIISRNMHNGCTFSILYQSISGYNKKKSVEDFSKSNFTNRLGTNIMYEHVKIGIFYTQAVLNLNSTQVTDIDSLYNVNTNFNIDFQIGYKNHNLINVKGLNLQLEYNITRHIKSFWQRNGDGNHVEVPSQYALNSNYGQSLTIPKNQNTYLFVAMLSYQIKMFKIMTMYNLSPDTYFLETTGITPTYAYPDCFVHPKDRLDFQFIYEMNPVNRMQWFAGISMYNIGQKPVDYYFSIGFRTALRNNY